jgi:DNA (cytosine-5)-methyltransferase 1
MLTVGSLFAGIGGLELGLERTGGFKTIWQVEIDPKAIRVLEEHWPNVRRWHDVRTFPPTGDWSCDVISGGFPCIDISSNGKRNGITGEHSGLWKEMSRIIRALRPRYVIVENVSDLLYRGLGRVLGDLAESGYDAEWDVLPGAAFGAAQARERLFVVAYACEQRCQKQCELRIFRQIGLLADSLAAAKHKAANASSVVRGMDADASGWLD